MAKLKLLSAALSPQPRSQLPLWLARAMKPRGNRARGANASAFDGPVGISAPSVAHFLRCPGRENCDVGDNRVYAEKKLRREWIGPAM